eukprot:612871-Prorocentrum_lima.AAC.1
MARTTINLAIAELYEDHRIILGVVVPDLLGPLPLPEGLDACGLHTIVYFDPWIKRPTHKM